MNLLNETDKMIARLGAHIVALEQAIVQMDQETGAEIERLKGQLETAAGYAEGDAKEIDHLKEEIAGLKALGV